MSRQPQRWDPERYARNARFVAELGAPLLELLEPQPGEQVLDLGCGDGALTEKLLEAGCRVVAIDTSPEQVAAARARGLDARVASAEALPFAEEFDAVFSNAVLHWVRDADAALAGVYRSLRAGGRFVGEMGGDGCIGSIREALGSALERRGIDADALDPWYFPNDREYRERLERHGFVVRSLRLFERPTPLPGDISGWLETFAQPFLSAVSEQERGEVVAEIRDLLRPQLYDPSSGWVADYVRLRFVATRP